MASDDDRPLSSYLLLPEAADQMEITERSLKRMIYEGRIASIKHAGRIWVAKKEIQDYFARLAAQGAKRRASAAKNRRNTEREAAAG